MAPLQACSVPLTRSGRHGSKFVNPKTATPLTWNNWRGEAADPVKTSRHGARLGL